MMSKKSHKAVMPDRRAVHPHTFDTAPSDINIKPTPSPTQPGSEPYAAGSQKLPQNDNAKLQDLDAYRSYDDNQSLTTTTGVKLADNQNSLKAGVRGPTLMEDFLLRDKMMHFDRERIPERVVHARGAAAHGYFHVYKSLDKYTKAGFLNDSALKTPVFVRFSTVQGSRGSADTARDVRGFAVKFYTQEGNFDIVGVNTPTFFIQDAIKFPDFVHAIKPEPINEVPQGQSAHDSFWDYVSLQPETIQNVMVVMSDRGIPRSYSNIEGFGIHTFRFVNSKNESYFVRFHWKPVAGTCSLIWDEAQVLMGRDPDFHRKNLWESIEAGNYPEYELGLQIIPEGSEHNFDFDILDPTKLIPEALVPVQRIGKLVLNRNPDNYFAETEQVAFCPANLVPGIDFSNDPLLQGRIFSYVDTQMHRLGGANFNEIPINKPVCPFHNQQRDGFHRMEINTNPANYEPNSINNNWPRETAPKAKNGGFSSYHEKIDADKIRQRSESMTNFYSMPRLFWQSQTPTEQQHIINAFSFELGKVARPYIRERVVDLLCHINSQLAQSVAKNLGIELTSEQKARPAPVLFNQLDNDPTLSLYACKTLPLTGRKVAILATDGVCGESVDNIREILSKNKIYSLLLAPHMGMIKTLQGKMLKVDGTIEGNPSVTVDAVIVPTNQNMMMLVKDGNAKYYLQQAYKHLKAIALHDNAKALFDHSGLEADNGILLSDNIEDLVKALMKVMTLHRVWEREQKVMAVPA